MTKFTRSNKTRINRLPKRGHYDRETIYNILDEALICHVGFVRDGQPFVIPTNFARMNDHIVLHGAKASRLLKHIEAGNPVCVEATIVDGLVLARSVFHHSVNYRSVVGKQSRTSRKNWQPWKLSASISSLSDGRKRVFLTEKNLMLHAWSQSKSRKPLLKFALVRHWMSRRIIRCPSGREFCHFGKCLSPPSAIICKPRVFRSPAIFQNTHARAPVNLDSV